MARNTSRPEDLTCTKCGTRWIGSGSCPNGCDGLAKSDGEFTKKTFQGTDDLRKSGR